MRLVSYMSPGFPASLFELLASKIDASVHFETEMSGPQAGTDPFADGTFDLGWICSTSFVELALRDNNPSIRLAGVAWVPDDPGVSGQPVYFGDLLTSAASTVESLADLRGCRIGCNDVISLSGHHALRFAIETLGENPTDFAELVFTGGHDASMDALRRGQVDACVVDSVVRTARARHDPTVANFRLVDRLGPWPVQPLVVRRDMAYSVVREIRQKLLGASDGPDLQAEFAAAGLVGLVPVDNAHYATVKAARESSFRST